MKTKITLMLLAFSAVSLAQTIAIPEFATGLSGPVEITHAGDSRLFVVQQSGAIRILNADGTLKPNNFLTLTNSTISTGGERGLLGLAFHPQYASNGYFYVNYTRAGDGATVIARYAVDPNNPDAALPTGTVLLTVSQPFTNHNGGTIKFGPDGYLYIGMGDGGSGGDPGNRAQNINENLGKMLRINVDLPNGNVLYTNPADNPFVGVDGNDEIWAVGLRNPWKFSFDRVSGDLWIADVGQNAVEEINHVAATAAGLNYGWKCYEGNAVYTPGCANPNTTYTYPVATYPHSGGACSITGGYVYRGSAYPGLVGKYFFADLCLNRVGMVDTATNAIAYSATFSTGNPNNTSFSWTSLGEDVNGELYIASASLGKIYRITDTTLAVQQFGGNMFEITPNPANSEFFVRMAPSDYPLQLSVVDASGRIVHEQQIESERAAISTGSLPGGIYMIDVTDRSGNKGTSKLGVTH